MENILEKEPVKRVQEFINQFDPKLKVLVLDTTARTAKDAAHSLDVEVGAIVKSLVFKTPKKNLYYLCLVSGDKLISLNKLSLNVNDEVEKASANEVKSRTGYSIGGVPPVAHINSPTQIFIDLNLKRFAKIYAAAGHPYCVFGITFKQICEITNGKVIDFVE